MAKTVRWRCNTPQLLKEIGTISDKGAGIMKQPLNIFARILAEVSDRAIELNDPKLNSLMARLALYDQCDPYSKNYDKKLTEKTIEKGA